MKLQTLSIYILLLSTFCTSYSQERDADGGTLKISNKAKGENLYDVAKQMFININNKDVDAIVNMNHPKIFESIDKAQLKTQLKTEFEGNNLLTIEYPNRIPDFKVSEISKLDYKDVEYAFVSYDMQAKINFKQKLDKLTQKSMKELMSSKGMDVKFTSKNSMSVMMKDKITILLKDKLTGNSWKMIDFNKDLPYLTKVVLKEVLDAAERYKQELN